MDLDSVMLNMLAEKIVQPAIRAGHVTYCPTMDLIALATTDEQVHVHRLNGQKVFGVTNRQPAVKINGLRWKPNGQSLAVAFSNHMLSLTSSHTGKVMHQIDCSAHSASQICCLGWGINFTDSHALRDQLERPGTEKSLDEILSEGTQSGILGSVSNLPLDLAFLDIEGTLPKLSTLAIGGTDDDIFNSRASLDAMFQPLTKSSTDSADILVVGFEDGTVHLSIYDFFEIGSFNLQQASHDLKISKPIMHCSHPYSTTHPLLVSASPRGGQELYVVPLDLRLVSGAGRYLSLLASKSTQLQNILRYIHQVHRQMYDEFKTSQDLPSKFMRNIEETLQEKCDCTWVQAAYHLVVTGNCYPPVKEWLVDELGERGHKRWEKVALAGYENVRRLAHENLIPALERICVLVSRLRGFSRFQDSNATLGLSTEELDNILDTVNCVQLLAHYILICAGSELRQFTAFSAWLRQEIVLQSVDAASTSAHEAAEKDFNIDHMSTLEYIQGAMMQSQLIGYFNMQSHDDQRPQMDLSAERRSLYGIYKRELKDLGKDIVPQKRLPGLQDLISHLDTQCNLVFTRIAETQRRNVRLGPPISLGTDIPACVDMRLVIGAGRKVDADEYVLYVALGPTRLQAGIRVCRVLFKIENGMSSTQGIECALVKIPMPIESVRDVKFVDDEALMIALTTDSSSRLLSVDYRTKSDASGGLQYTATEASPGKGATSLAEADAPSLDLQDQEHMAELTRHVFPGGDSWAPENMDINGRKGRRVMCVVARDKKRYRIYDVDSHPDLEESENIGDDGDDDDVMREDKS